MNLQKELLEWLNREVTIKNVISINKFNVPTYREYILSNVFWQDDNSIKFERDGQIIESSIKLYSLEPINLLDVIVIDSIEWKIGRDRKLRDDSGNIVYYIYYL